MLDRKIDVNDSKRLSVTTERGSITGSEIWPFYIEGQYIKHKAVMLQKKKIFEASLIRSKMSLRG